MYLYYSGTVCRVFQIRQLATLLLVRLKIVEINVGKCE